MINLPFNPHTFSQEAKDIVSGVNLTFSYDNIKSRLTQVAVVMQKVLGKQTYDQIAEINPEIDDVTLQSAYDCLKRAMLNFAFYHHLIFIAVRISNDGVTTKKNDDETTAFKYQTDELKISLVESAWFWMDQLYQILEENKEVFEAWQDSVQYKQLKSLIVTVDDFAYQFGIDSNYFFATCAPLIRRSIDEDITPRVVIEDLQVDEADADQVRTLKGDILSLIKKAIVFRTLSLACKQYSFHELPAPLRKIADNEMHKGQPAEEYVQKNVASMLANSADSALQKLEAKIKLLKNKSTTSPIAPYPENILDEGDKFFFSL